MAKNVPDIIATSNGGRILSLSGRRSSIKRSMFCYQLEKFNILLMKTPGEDIREILGLNHRAGRKGDTNASNIR
jgi:hypothetical protein